MRVLPNRIEGMMELVVLAYHKIGPPAHGLRPTPYYVSENTFRRHLKTIADAGWECASHGEFVEILRDPAKTAARKVLITLDDAYSNSCDLASRLLQSCGYPFVVFVPTAYVGGINTWDNDIEPAEHICNWNLLERLQKRGASIESHSKSHRRFSTLSKEEIGEELNDSRLEIKRMLGVAATSFAYPYGDRGSSSETTARLLSSLGYQRAFCFGGTTVRCATTDLFCLDRVAVYEDTCLAKVFNSR